MLNCKGFETESMKQVTSNTFQVTRIKEDTPNMVLVSVRFSDEPSFPEDRLPQRLNLVDCHNRELRNLVHLVLN